LLVVPDLACTFTVRQIEDNGGLVEAKGLDAGEGNIFSKVESDGPPLFVRIVRVPDLESFKTVLSGLEKNSVNADFWVVGFGGGFGGRAEEREFGFLIEVEDLFLVIIESVRNAEARFGDSQKAGGPQTFEDGEGIVALSGRTHMIVLVDSAAVPGLELFDELVDTVGIHQAVGIGMDIIDLPVRLDVSGIEFDGAEVGQRKVGVDLLLQRFALLGNADVFIVILVVIL